MGNSYWKDRNVFVTGSTGLLGSWLTRELVDNGANVVALIRDVVPKSQLCRSGYYNKVTIVNGAVEDYSAVERALNEYEIETIFHLAAQTIVGTANRSPLSTFESNIKGTWVLMEAARNSRMVKRVVVASSDKAYGEHKVLPYSEEAPLKGTHPYDVSKSCADLISQSYFNTYKLPVCITRCGNLYGGGDLNWNRIIPGTIRSVVNGERPIIRSDGSYIRDYFYVEDAVKAYIGLAEKMDDDRIWGEAFNFSNEIQVPVLQLVNMLLKQMDSPLTPNVLNEAKGEIRHQYLSAEKARKVLGWRPEFTLEKGLELTIKWYREFLKDGAR